MLGSTQDKTVTLSVKTSSHDSFFASVRQLIGARAFVMLLQFLSLPVLTRLLSIEDFAIVALGMVIPHFANTFSDAGFGKSLIRLQRFDHAEWSTVFWFLAAVGAGLGCLVMLAAPFYAQITGVPELFAVMIVLALLPFLQSLSAVYQAWIERDFGYKKIANILMISGLASLAIAIGLALLGFGYWALVIQQVLLVAVQFAAYAYASVFRPKLTFQPKLLRSHFGFGVNTLLFSGVMAIQKQLPVLAFNQLFGMLAVSLWSMSERLSRFPKIGAVGPFSRVTMVSMSRQWRDGAGAADAGETYLATSRLLAILLFPGLIVAGFHARPVFVWFLSTPWGDVAPLFGLAVPALLAELVSSIGARVFMVANRTDLRLRMSIERFILGTILFLFALPFGLEAAIAVRSLFAVLYMPRYWGYMNKCVPLSIISETKALILPVGIGLTTAILGLYIRAPLDVSTLQDCVIVIGLSLIATGITVLLTFRQMVNDVAWLRNST